MSWDDVVAGEASIAEPTGAYRPIRRVGPPGAPLAGELAAAGDDVVQLVRADAADGWEGWRAAGAQHVLAPIDIVRLPDGHALALPWCVERLEPWLAARVARGPALSGGEVVTLAVSLLRGVQEAWAGRAGDEQAPCGEWWLTDEARPVLALDVGDPAEASARRVLAAVGDASGDRVLRRALDECATALERPRGLHRALAELEARLFDACAPRPLLREEGGASEEDRAERIEPRRGARRADRDAPSAWSDWIGRHVDAGVGAMVADAWDGLREGSARLSARARRGRGGRTGSRRAPLLVGALCAACVLLAGALWPSDDQPGADAAEHPPETAEVAAEGGGANGPADADGGGPPAEVEHDAVESELREDAGAPELPEHETPEQATARLVEGSDGSSVTLVDDFGDVAVTRAVVDGEPRHVVLERVEGTWRLRQLYETAKGAG